MISLMLNIKVYYKGEVLLKNNLYNYINERSI